MSKELSPSEAWVEYGLEKRDTSDISDFEAALRQEGIATVDMPLTPDDFACLETGFAECLDYCPEELANTTKKFDKRRGSAVGYKQKDLVRKDGVQLEDPKEIFQFYQGVREEWRDKFRNSPKALRDFLEAGAEIQDSVLAIAESSMAELNEGTYTNASDLYFPNKRNRAFMRVVRYAAYEPFDEFGNVVESLPDIAKRHYDIGGMTLQVYATDTGFEINKEGIEGSDSAWEVRDSNSGEAQVFFGKSHEKVYGEDDSITPLFHKVTRRIPADKQIELDNGTLVMSREGKLIVPARTAIVMFVDAPDVNTRVTKLETLGELGRTA